MDRPRSPSVKGRRPPVAGRSGLVGAVLLGFLLSLRPGEVRAEPPAPPAAAVIDSVRALWGAGDRDGAHACVAATLPRLRAAADTLQLGRLLILQGQMFATLGDSRRGEPPLAEGIDLARAAADTSWQLRGMRWYGVCLGYNLKHAEAEALFRDMGELARSARDSTHWGWAEAGLAFQAGRTGDVATERRHYEQAVALFRAAGDVRGEVFALNGLGTVLDREHDFTAARACYDRTLTVARGIGDTFVEALAENNLGALEYGVGDPGRAAEHFRRAYALHTAGGVLQEAVAVARNVAICLTALGDYDRALELLDDAIATCRERGFTGREYSAQTEKAIVLTMQRRPARAERLLADLIARPDPVTARDRLEAVLGRAVALAQLGRAEEAATLMLGFAGEARSLGDTFLRFEYGVRLGRLLNDTGRPDEALVRMAELEREGIAADVPTGRLVAPLEAGRAWRALARPDSALACLERAAAVWREQRGVPRDPVWRERRGEEGRRIHLELADLLLNGTPSGDADRRLRRAYALLQEFKARTLFERMVGPQATPAQPREPTTLAAVQAALAADEVLLDCFLGADHSFVFAVTRTEVRVADLPPAAELAERVALFRALLGTGRPALPGRGEAVAAGRDALRRLLLDPVADVLAGRTRLICCPDGVLNRLPEAFLAGPGVVACRVPSASIFADLRAGLAAAPAAVGSVWIAGGGVDGSGRQLAAAVREVAWLERRYADRAKAPLRDDDARLPDGDLIHLASHVEVSDTYPWRSAVHLGGDTVVSAADIAATRRSARLAVLAGCESGGGAVSDGGGVMGLGSAFIAAGTPTVVASLWPVDDAATFRLMHGFYRGLEGGGTVAGALAAAQRELAADSRFADPYYWAGFVVIGEGNQRLDLSPARSSLPAGRLLGAGALLLAAVAAFSARGRFS
ncbi:CHAT domain-containing protein [bacterium]|nr:CHAT domain-containing protein [bacterium]